MHHIKGITKEPKIKCIHNIILEQRPFFFILAAPFKAEQAEGRETWQKQSYRNRKNTTPSKVEIVKQRYILNQPSTLVLSRCSGLGVE